MGIDTILSLKVLRNFPTVGGFYRLRGSHIIRSDFGKIKFRRVEKRNLY